LGRGTLRANLYSVLFLAAITLASSFLIVFPVNSQPAHGNWIVTGTEIVENQMIMLDGNLTVQSGGSLTLRNVTLIVNCQFNGQYQILVENNGSMRIEDSKITPSNLDCRYSFIVEGDYFILKNSELYGAGWYDEPGASYAVQGDLRNTALRIEGNYAVIENNIIAHNSIAIMVVGCNNVIKGNIFNETNIHVIHLHSSSSNNTIDSNTINHTKLVAISGDGANQYILNNTINLNNPLGNLGCAGISAQGANFTISNNTIFADNGIMIGKCINAIIAYNYVVNDEHGIYVMTGVNNRIIGNNVTIASNIGTGGGIELVYAYNNLVTNNDQPTETLLDHSSNNTIVNNNLSVSGLRLIHSKNNIISGNIIGNAFMLYYESDNNTIFNNNFSFGWWANPFIEGSSKNTIFGNNFFMPKGLEITDYGSNNWNSSEKGNYWSTYTGVDANGDQIGDTHFAIPLNSTDFLPLISPLLTTSVTVPPMTYLPISEMPKNSGGFGLEWKETTIFIENQTLEIKFGGLYIPKGCTLIIKNSTLIMGSKGMASINCAGGTLVVENSTIKDAEYSFGYCFEVGSNGSIHVKSSTLIGITRGDHVGLMLDAAQTAIIEDTLIIGTPKIIVFTTPVHVINCTFSQNERAVVVAYSDNVEICNNTILDGLGGFGVVSDGNTNITIANNIIFKTSGAGITIDGKCQNVTIVNNTIMNCLGPGIDLGSDGLLVYHNNFINNSVDCRNRGNNNQLDFNGEGNYYSDYSGNDANLDGIGDKLFTISYQDYQITDNHPFMRENGWLTEFYLTLSTNLGSIPFLINNSVFATGQDGIATQRLGYVGDYTIEMAINCTIQEGTKVAFVRWRDGLTNNTRTVQLSSNRTLSVEYKTRHLICTNTSLGGTLDQAGGWFDEGTTITLNAISSSGYRLVNFTTIGSVSLISQNGSSATVMVSGLGTITANFSAIPPDYTCIYVAAAIVTIVAAALALFWMKKRKSRSKRT